METEVKRKRAKSDMFHVEQAEAIVSIIAACGQHGVCRFKMGDIEIDFFVPEGEYPDEIGYRRLEKGLTDISDLSKTPDTSIATHDSSDTQRRTINNVVLDEETLEEFRKSELLAHDPVAFEEELIAEMEGQEHAEDDYSGVEPII